MALTLPQELLLLGLDDETGKRLLAASSGLPYGLVAAGLFELALDGTISFGDKRIVVHRTRPTGDVVLDPLLQWLAEKPRKPARALTSRTSGIVRRASDQLVTAGVLRFEEHTILGVIPGRRYPTRDARPERDLRARLNQVVRHHRQPDERTAALAVIVQATSMTKLAFPEGDVKEINLRLAEIAGGTWSNTGIRDFAMELRKLVRAAQAAGS